MFDLEHLPSRLVVVGGGYIACEFATIFARLGSHVVQIHRGERVLRGFDDEVADVVARQARERGVDLQLGRKVAALEPRPGGVTVRLDDGHMLAGEPRAVRHRPAPAHARHRPRGSWA